MALDREAEKAANKAAFDRLSTRVDTLAGLLVKMASSNIDEAVAATLSASTDDLNALDERIAAMVATASGNAVV